MLSNNAVDAIHNLMRGLSPVELHRLDASVRQSAHFREARFYEWIRLTPQEIERVDTFGGASISVFGFASFHYNGYVREAAIKKLSQFTTGAEIPFLIIRLNDWVPNVRNAAYEAIRLRIKPEYCRPIIDNLLLLRRLENAARVDNKEIIETIRELLQTDSCRPQILETLNMQDRFIRRESFKLLLDATKPDFEELAKRALSDDDTVIRLLGAKRISAACEGPTCESFFESMKRDRYMPVRREALRMAVRFGPPRDLEELRNALLDSHASMREESRYQLRKMQPFDVAAFYREHLKKSESRTLYAVVSGLAESGSAEDDGLIVAYASHPIRKIRMATVKALASLRPDAHLETFTKALTDEASHVSYQAVRALRRKPWALNMARLLEFLRSTPHLHVKRNVIYLIERCAKWDSISYLLNTLCDPNENVVMMSRSAIDDWLGSFNRSFSSPTQDQLAAIRDALERCGHLLDESSLERLQFSLKGF